MEEITEAGIFNMKVYIWDEKIKNFLSDESGTSIKYDSTNIEHSEIWKSTSRGYDLVLTLQNVK